MSKKHEMSEQEYLIYKKQHDYRDAVETEEGKIRREKADYVHLRNRGKSIVKLQLQSVLDLQRAEVLEEMLDQSEEDRTASRTNRNANTHKHRLTGLAKHEDEAASTPEEGA